MPISIKLVANNKIEREYVAAYDDRDNAIYAGLARLLPSSLDTFVRVLVMNQHTIDSVNSFAETEEFTHMSAASPIYFEKSQFSALAKLHIRA